MTVSSTHNVPSPVLDSRELRDALGHFCSGITIVTAQGEDGPVGFTCQSFSALSLSPPQVILCPSRSSTSWPSIKKARRFCINVLSDRQRHLSDRFAVSGGDKFDGVPWVPTPGGAPLLEDVTAWFDVTFNAEHDGGDHVVVIADVNTMGASKSHAPLLYHRGSYALAKDWPRD